MTEEEIRPIAENYVEEFCHDIHGGYEDGDLVCAGIGTALIVARKLEQQNKELQKQISVLLSCKDCPDNKGGYICEKEYNDKCLTQKIQYIKELQEEVSEWKTKFESLKRKCSFNIVDLLEDVEKEYKHDKQIADAKEIIKKYLVIGVGGKITQNYLDVTKEAE